MVVATNVNFNKAEMTKIAMMANCGAARAIVPYHDDRDGDQLYALSTNKLKVNVSDVDGRGLGGRGGRRGHRPRH